MAGTEEFDEEESLQSERELADDAQWKIIQKNTFTRWANEHLKTVNKSLTDLEGDFSDGLRLIALIEVLSGKKFKHINKRPNFRTQKLENVTMTLKCLEEDEGIRIVNIDSTDIVDKKLKLILGLIWTLILHYSISMPMWEGEEPTPSEGAPTPKQRLLNWINGKLPEMPVKNFTTDWNNGRAIGALVDAIGPGLCPDWEEWDPKKAKENAKEAMDAAEKYLGVPQLIKPNELTSPKVDDLSMMTYLSQFPNAKLKSGAPVRPKINPTRVRAYGPGLESKGNQVGAPARFTVETFSAGKGEVEVMILNPKGGKEKCEIVFNNDKNKTYSCVYIPTMEGQYRVIVKFAVKEIPKSPFTVNVEGAAGDPTKVTAKGPGIEKTGVVATKKTYFEVYTKDAIKITGKGNVDVVILDPRGRKDTVKPSIQPVVGKEGTYMVEYVAIEQGTHSVSVFFAGSQIPKSPFTVQVGAPSNAKACYASGRGIQPRGIRVKEEAIFYVHTEGAGEGDVEVHIIGPGGAEEKCQIRKTPTDARVYECIYIPAKPGNYIVNVTFADQAISKSPFKVDVGPIWISKIVAFGPGLEGGVVNQPANFTVETNGEVGALGFSIEGPSEAKIDCKDNGDGSADVTYWPTVPGEYAVHILCNNQDIPKSPYMAQVKPATKEFNAGKVIAKGPGLQKTGVQLSKWAEFTVDTKLAGKAALNITCMDVDYKPVEVQVKDNKDGTFSCRYMPTKSCKYTVTITYGGVNVPNSPFRVYIGEPSTPAKVKVYGPGVSAGVKTNTKTYFVIDCKQAGPGDVAVALTDEHGKDVPVKTIDQKDGTFRVEYEPKTPGIYTVQVYFAGSEVPQSPIKVTVETTMDTSGIKVEGLEPKIPVGVQKTATIRIPPKLQKAAVKMNITSPSGKTTNVPINDMMDRKVAPFTLQEPGPHTVDVTYGGVPVKDSPFKVDAVPDVGLPKVKAYGPGLASGEAMKPAQFTIDTREETKPGNLGVTVEGPKESKIDVKDNGDGTCGVTYVPELPGDYKVNVTHADQPIKGSPFTAKIKPSTAAPAGDAPRVKAYGPGLKSGEAKKPATFTIDTREETRPGGLGVTVEGPKESKIDCLDNGDGTCSVSYLPEVPGDYKVNVTHAEKPIPGSPFTASIKPSTGVDLSGVKAYGPGLSPDGVFTEAPTEFTVDAHTVNPTGDGQVQAVLTTPTGRKVQTQVSNKKDGTYPVLYTPIEKGPQVLDVTYNNAPIPGSPFKVNAVPGNDPNKVRAYGPGLERGVTNKPNKFTVDMKGAGKGALGLAMQGPTEAKMQCKDNHDGTCEVEYFPNAPGNYDINVNFAGKPIPDSPFRVRVSSEVDASKVKCYGPGVDAKAVTAGVPVTFTVDTKQAGDAPLQVTYTDQTGAPRPANVVPVEDGVYNVSYVPSTEGKCKVDVTYGGTEVPKSPFQMRVIPTVDVSKVKVFGPGVEGTTPASLPAQFTVDTRATEHSFLECFVQRPDGSFIRPAVEDKNDGTYDVSYTPEDLGVYDVSVKYAGQDVPGAPFHVKATPTGDASKCKIKEGANKLVPVNKETVITVDAAEAGNGKVTCRIRQADGSEIDIDIIENVDGTFSICFTPQYPGDYTIEIKFGGNPIPDGQYTIQAVADDVYADYQLGKPVGAVEEMITADQMDNLRSMAPGGAPYQTVDFCFQVGPVFNFVSATITTPSGKTAYPKIEDNGDGTVTVKYQPTESGLHKLHMMYNNEEIEGSPFMFHVEPVNTRNVTAYGPGLSHGVVDEPAFFTINTKQAGPGGLSLAVEGPSKTDIKCVDNQDGTCTVSYVPTAPGEYNITVKFADKNIVGSPFTAKIVPAAGEPRKRAQLSVGSSSEVSLKVTETDVSSLTATVRSPSGREEPCLLKRLANGHLGMTFTPSEKGEHLVNVFRNGKHIPNSPFKVMVGESELGNASKVKVTGKGIKEGMANEVNEFFVDTREAGYGNMSMSIEGPSKADIECHDMPDGTCRVTYTPTEPGTYVLNLKFADQPVPGSPFTVKVGGEPSAKITERITRQRAAADVSHVGSECELSLKIPGTSPRDMQASVKSPSGATEVCDVTSLDDSHYSVKFVPKEMGVHTVSVKHKDMHIPGSPFQFTVGPIAGGGSHKVHAAGPGLERGEVNQPCDFNIYTREAGAGGLSIAVEGPSKAEIDFQDRKDGSCGVTYNVTEPGEYYVSIKFNDEHIPDSPFRVPISPSIGDARKISMSALQDKGLQVGDTATFVVNPNGAKGTLQARIQPPSGGLQEALVQEMDNGQHAVRFIPRENGLHLVHVLFGGYHIPGSPFRVMVGKVASADAGKVTAYGDGLYTGKTGQVSRFVVNTVNAGAGALAVTVEGPSKVQLECREVDEGYEFKYCPKAPGDYLITIRYAGVNIAGSPFKARVEGAGQPGQPSGVQEHASVVVETVTKTSTTTKFTGLQQVVSDASKCVPEGSALTQGLVGQLNTFTVDTTGAGNNMMFVGMMGPERPVDELVVKFVGSSKYSVSYKVTMKGRYILVLRWGDQDLPGSPYNVQVA
ncbi:hypothetical protein ACOMHN_029211 [Nucella lapillus]